MPSNFKVLSGASGEPNDPNFKNVTLLLHGDGSNGAQNNTFIDSSTNNFTITRNGNTTQGSFSPYGSNWSNYFDGTSGQYLNAPANAAFNFGTGDFTIECWVYPTSTSGTRPIVEIRTSAANSTGFALLSQSGATTLNVYTNGGFVGASTGSLTVNQWNHVALTRSGNTWTYWINGVSGGTFTNSSTQSDGATTGPKIGGSTTAGEIWVGYISNVRIIKGTALYTSTFTPSTTPLTAVTNTSLLTCAYNRFRDGFTNNFTITANGDVKVTNFAPFAPSSAYSTSTNGGSAYFGASTDYLQTDYLTFGTGNFTLEMWLYFGGNTSTRYDFLSMADQGTSGFATVIDGGQIEFRYSGTSEFQTTTSVAINGWTHIAIVREGTATDQTKIYINGVLSATGTVTDNYGSSRLNISGNRSSTGGGGLVSSYLAGVRVTKSAVYTSGFTPPSSPPTNVSNTQYIINATNAAIFDNSMKNDLETVGNAQISTSVKKFGTGSMAFDGTGDWLTLTSNTELSFPSSFTVEFWINFSSVPSAYVALIAGTSANTQFFITTKSNGNGLRFGLTGVAEYAAGTKTWSTGTWYHVALVRNGSDVKFYVDGTNVSDSTYTNSTSYSGALQIGGNVSGTSDFPGYIDDFRITKGVARYTSNFTPPTAAFPNK